MINGNINISEELNKTISDVLEKELEKEFDIAIARFNHRKVEIIAGVLMNVQKSVDMNVAGDRITFTLREIKK